MSGVLWVWTVATTEGLEVVEAHAAATAAEVVHRRLPGLSAHLPAPRRPTVAVVEGDSAATEALAAGVDEVVCHSDVALEGLERAARRAVARAHVRAAEFEARQWTDDSAALSSLLDWVAIELVACVSGPILEAGLLDENLRTFLPEGRDTPSPLSPLPLMDLLEMLDSIRGSFQRMQEVLQALRVLADRGLTVTSLAALLPALSRVMLNRTLPVATVELEVEPGCATAIPTSKMVVAMVILMTGVLSRAPRRRSAPEERVRVVVRAFVADGTAVVEIEDDGEAYEADEATGCDPISAVRSRLRPEGVDVTVATSPGGQLTVRLVLPLAQVVEAVPINEDGGKQGSHPASNVALRGAPRGRAAWERLGE